MEHTERFGMRVSPEFLAAIDSWRRHQPDIPPRAEAIRRLVVQGLTNGNHVLVEAFVLLAQLDNGRPVTPEARAKFIEASAEWRKRMQELEPFIGGISAEMDPVLDALEAAHSPDDSASDI